MLSNTLVKQKEEKNHKQLLNTDDVARIYGVHPNTIRRWSNQGTIKSYGIGPRGEKLFRRENMAADFLHRAIQIYLGH